MKFQCIYNLNDGKSSLTRWVSQRCNEPKYLGIMNLCRSTNPFSTVYQTTENIIPSVVTVCPSKADLRAISQISVNRWCR